MGSVVVFPLRCLKETELAQGVEESQQPKGSATIWFFPQGHGLLLPSGPPSDQPDPTSEQCVPSSPEPPPASVEDAVATRLFIINTVKK